MIYRGVKFEALVVNLDDPVHAVGTWVELPVSKADYDKVLEAIGLSDNPERLSIESVIEPFSNRGIPDLGMTKYESIEELNKVAVAASIVASESADIEPSERFGLGMPEVAMELKEAGIFDDFGQALMCVASWPIAFSQDILNAEDVGRYWETEVCGHEAQPNVDYKAIGEKLLAVNDGYFRITDHGTIIGAVQKDIDRNDFEPGNDLDVLSALEDLGYDVELPEWAKDEPCR